MELSSPPEEGTIAVMVRVRPSAPCERERATQPILHVLDERILLLEPSVPPACRPKSQGKEMKFIFDRIFGEEATQEEVFQHTTCQMLDSVLNGYNCSVFAYGATGAGKTYTMLGSEKSPGIMYLTMVELYKRIEARKEEKSCEVLVSYQEVYNEQIHDLLEPKGPLPIREDPEKGVVVQGLSFHQPASAEQLLEMLANGNKNRTQHPTDANATSSRSHAIFQVCVKQQDRVGGLTQELQVAKMSLIDLAGSERASIAKTRGERLREGANINRSLLALVNVLKALANAKGKKTHIPYRDSKLTRLLKDSMGGNCRTVMIAAVSPSPLAYEDTYSTLKYANRAKEIKMSLKCNVLSFDCHISKYVVICEQLKAEVADLQAKLRAYEDAAGQTENQAPAPPPRLEGAILKTCLGLDGHREGGGGQQEMEAGWPVQRQLKSEEEMAPEEMLPSSPRATHQSDVQLELKKPSGLLQGLSGSQTETLVAAVLRVARKQYSLLRDANLLTPDLISEFEELERLVRQETGVSLEQATSPSSPAEVSEGTPAQRVPQRCDGEDVHSGSRCCPLSFLLACGEGRGQVPAVGTAQRDEFLLTRRPAGHAESGSSLACPIKKRRISERNSIPQLRTPCSLKKWKKHQQRSGKKARAPRAAQSPGTPCLKAEAQKPPLSLEPSCCTPKICPVTVTKNCVPLAMSAAQNCRSPPAHELNVTYEVCRDSGSPAVAKPAAPSLPEFSIWEDVQKLLNKQEGPFVPKANAPAFAVRGSLIPRPTFISKPSAQKRKQAE
ncbi:PREDICTED: kinesin-like protein KIF18B, partial [Chlamydotis macqueenii]|uniref:kinesin-like protein KIF18B n=1 Tax=Chlamydotis macqueenii TaxID=187382 RepID=UPI00052A0DC0